MMIHQLEAQNDWRQYDLFFYTFLCKNKRTHLSNGLDLLHAVLSLGAITDGFSM